jgi:hypothetical protein
VEGCAVFTIQNAWKLQVLLKKPASGTTGGTASVKNTDVVTSSASKPGSESGLESRAKSSTSGAKY